LSTSHSILIVEDDAAIAEAVEKHLAGWGYSPRRAGDFSDVMADFSADPPDLVLLDIALPFFNGYHWCREIRKVSRVPVIFISSTSDNMNIIMAVNQGGDDFIAKPFDLDVLTAKVEALLRRAYAFAGEEPALSAGGVTLNTKDISLRYAGSHLELTKNEYRILQVLLENKGRIVSRDTLMAKLWESDLYVDDNTLTVNINRLRRRLAELGLQGFIQTKRGMGYLVADD
jgi:two-component system response regulator protein BraR/BceR